MANENMEEYRTGPAIIDETVRVAKKYLEEHPEESPLPLRGAVAGREIVASFLNWPESRVGYSLERLSGQLRNFDIVLKPTSWGPRLPWE